ncbi:MAG: carboxypeptidase-like regulatory domain-containing protein [Rhodothermales bacterium]|nr:carboxypeptidase-like regulatory domain-containing protein [Rhodothermales bacterium]MBO6779645.1 carboxypeptidase-like regulatory domain-containing protein [Rhodothermales bacterium]
MLRKWGVFVLALLATPALVLAQNTGKVSGVVTDADTGEPLPGASVVVVGTQLGTISDVDGNYFIIGVPVGSYDIQASFVGFQTSTVAGVEVSSGYTQEVNFVLSAGVELDEIVVEYERPLIQKDAIGVPKIVDAEEIVNLPVRGAAEVAKIQAGVVSQEGSGTLNIRGGRGSEVTYYIDGVKIVGSTSLPQAAIQEQEMIIGNISARYGDAMSGVINITTKSGSTRFFGSLEGVTSESLDEFGYNLASVALGGPVGGENINFFLAAEFVDEADTNPRWIGELTMTDDALAQLQAFPNVMLALDGDGNRVIIDVPNTIVTGDKLPVDDDGNVLVSNGTITTANGVVISVPEGVEASSIDPELRESAAYLQTGADGESLVDRNGNTVAELDRFKKERAFSNFALNGNLQFTLLDDVRLRVGGRYVTRGGDTGISTRDMVFSPNTADEWLYKDAQFFATWTHYLSNSTFYQLQVDYTNRTGDIWDPAFSKSLDDVLSYGDIDHPANAMLKWPMNLGFTSETRIDDHGTPDDPSDDTEFTVQVPTYTQRWEDGRGANTETVANLVTPVAGRYHSSRSFFDTNQIRFQATATTQIGLHQLEFGGEFEQQTNRSYATGSASLARWVDDADGAENLATGEQGVTQWTDLTFEQMSAGYYGYNFYGTRTTDRDGQAGSTDAIADRANDCGAAVSSAAPEECYDIAPWKPLYYGGYIQDKIEFRDIVLNLGLRVDVFDNNTRVLADRYSRLPLVRVADVGGAPANVPSNAAPYYNGNDVIGYRDTDGLFYDANGQEVPGGDILLTGAKPRTTSNVPTSEGYEDYEPQVTLMPRIGVSFPVTNEALFFARYGVVSQRPSSNNFSTIASFARATGTINNTALEPESITEYELGFRQRLSLRSALTISGFFRQIENLIQRDDLREAFPQGYLTWGNKDFGTVKGVEVDFDLRRTGGVALNANYTLAFAQGTGSNSNTTSIITWIDETPPNFISPLDFDQRHKVNLSLDYRLGAGEGPTVFGAKLFENMGFNILGTAGSGFPYTPQVEPFSIIDSKAPVPSGGINSDRMPWTSRVDLRIDRKFAAGQRSTVSAFLWVQNVLDQENVQNVWRATGLPGDDGFLSTSGGQQFLSGQVPAAEALYRHRTRGTGAWGLPRMTRIGVRVDF